VISRGIPKIPAFNATVSVTRRKWRFTTTGNVSVTDTQLLDMFCVATSSTAAYRLLAALRLRRLQVWAQPLATGATVEVEYPSTGQVLSGPSKLFSDTSLGTTMGAFVSATPPSDSLQSKWITTGTGSSWFTIANVNMATLYIDVEIDMVFQDNQTPVAVSASVAGATVGQIYLRSFASMVPIGYATI
jgi:hypothetical protein